MKAELKYDEALKEALIRGLPLYATGASKIGKFVLEAKLNGEYHLDCEVFENGTLIDKFTLGGYK